MKYLFYLLLGFFLAHAINVLLILLNEAGPTKCSPEDVPVLYGDPYSSTYTIYVNPN